MDMFKVKFHSKLQPDMSFGVGRSRLRWEEDIDIYIKEIVIGRVAE
jgi:hypothetical protein